MQQTVSLSDVIFEFSIRGLIVRLSNMAGVSTGSIQILIVCALLGLIALLLLRFGEPILWAIFGKPEPAEPAPLPYNENLNKITARALIGREGTAQAPLRPMGIAKVDGRTYTVKSEGIYIDPGTPIRVDSIEGPHIIVVPLMEDA